MTLFNPCLVGKRWPGAFREYMYGEIWSIKMPTDAKMSEAPENQHRVQPGGLEEAMASNEQ